jgi:hypothetical protein
LHRYMFVGYHTVSDILSSSTWSKRPVPDLAADQSNINDIWNLHLYILYRKKVFDSYSAPLQVTYLKASVPVALCESIA